MKIRVKAEETIYLEYFVDVPKHILEDSKDRLSNTYLKKAIHKWINENEMNFYYQHYDSVREWYEWEEVTEKETA